MNAIFTDKSILEQDIVSISEGCGAVTNGVSLIISAHVEDNVAAVEVLLTYEELKAAIALLVPDRIEMGWEDKANKHDSVALRKAIETMLKAIDKCEVSSNAPALMNYLRTRAEADRLIANDAADCEGEG